MTLPQIQPSRAGWRSVPAKYLFDEIVDLSDSGTETLLSVSEYFGVSPRAERIDPADHLSRAESLEGYKRCKDGDLVINIMLAWKRALGVTRQDGIVSPAYAVFRPRAQRIRPQFAHYLLRSDKSVSEFKKYSTGVIDSRLRLYPDVFLSLPVFLPLIDEQDRIANFLDEQTARIDALIAEKERLQAALKEWREAELTRICFGGSDASEPTGNSWIRVLPKGWRLVRLKHLAAGIEQGWSPECESRAAEEGDWGVLKAGASNGGHYRDSEQKALPAELDPIPSLEVHVGDVLVSRASGSADLVGSFAYVYGTRSRLMLSDKNFRLQFAGNPPLLPELLAWMCNTDALRKQVRQYVSGADGLAKNIGSGNLRELWLAVPPLEMQSKLIDELRHVKQKLDALEAHLSEHIDRLREYRASLISAAVTGQLNVDAFEARQLEAA